LSSPFEDVWEAYRKFSIQLGIIWSDWIKNNGFWAVPVSGTLIRLLADGLKIWGPQWFEEQYRKSKESG